MSNLSLIEKLIANSNTIIIDDYEAITIESIDLDEKTFVGTGEETGESYCVNYTDIDHETTTFYHESYVNPKDFDAVFGETRQEAKRLFEKLLDANPKTLLTLLETLAKSIS